MINVSRRGLLAGLAGIITAAAAPAIIKTPGLIMPIKPKLVVNDSVPAVLERGWYMITGTDAYGKQIIERIDFSSPSLTTFNSIRSIKFSLRTDVTNLTIRGIDDGFKIAAENPRNIKIS